MATEQISNRAEWMSEKQVSRFIDRRLVEKIREVDPGFPPADSSVSRSHVDEVIAGSAEVSDDLRELLYDSGNFQELIPWCWPDGREITETDKVAFQKCMLEAGRGSGYMEVRYIGLSWMLTDAVIDCGLAEDADALDEDDFGTMFLAGVRWGQLHPTAPVVGSLEQGGQNNG